MNSKRRDGRRGVATASAKTGSETMNSSILSSIPGFEGLTEMILPCQRELKYVVATATSSSYRKFQATDASRNGGVARETNSPGSPGVSAVPPPKEAISPTSVAGISHESLTQPSMMLAEQLSLPSSPLTAATAKTPSTSRMKPFSDAMGEISVSGTPPTTKELPRETVAEKRQESSSDTAQLEKAFSEFLRQNPSFGLSSFDTASMLRQKLIKMNQDKARVEAELTSQIHILMKSKRDMEEELEGQLKKLMEAKSARRQDLTRQIIAAKQSMRAMEERMEWGIIVDNVDRVNETEATWSHGHRFAFPHHKDYTHVHGAVYPSLLSDGDSSLDGSSGGALELNHLGSVEEEEEHNRSDIINDERDNNNEEMRQEKEDRTNEVNLSNVGLRETASTASGNTPQDGNSCDPDPNTEDENFEGDQSTMAPGDEAIPALEQDLHQFKIDNAILATEISFLEEKLEAQDTKNAGLPQVEGVLGQIDDDSRELLSSKLQAVKSKVVKVEADGHDMVSRMRGDAEFDVKGLNTAEALIPNEDQEASFLVDQETLGNGTNSENAGSILFPPTLTLQEKGSPDEFAARCSPAKLSNLEPATNGSKDEVPALPKPCPMETGGHDAISIPGDAEETVTSTQNSSPSQDNASTHSVPPECCGEIQTSHAAMAPSPSINRCPQVMPMPECLEQNRPHVIPVVEDDTQSYEGAKTPLPTDDEMIVDETGQEEHEVKPSTEKGMMENFSAVMHRPSQSSKDLWCVLQHPLPVLPKQEEESNTAAEVHQNTFSFYNHTHHDQENEEEMLDVMKEMVLKSKIRADRGGRGRRAKPAPEMGLTT